MNTRLSRGPIRVVAVRLAIGLVILRFVLSVYWAVALPPFEAHDETGHFTYAHFIARERLLPTAPLTEWFDETHQPPLYYVLAAGLGGMFAPSEPYHSLMNPYFMTGDGTGGLNAALHDPTLEGFPGPRWQQFLLAGRILSAALSAVAVWFIFRAALLALPSRPMLALVAAALAALTPTWIFVGGAMTNDALATLTGALVLWASLRLLLRTRVQLEDFALAGTSLGGALLTKTSLLSLTPFAAWAVYIASRRVCRDTPAGAVRGAVLFLALAFLPAASWYLRNYLLFGQIARDRAGANPLLQTAAPFLETLGKTDLPAFASALLAYAFRTYWGEFTWGTIYLPDWFYAGALAFSVVAGVGFVRGVMFREWPRITWMVVAFVIATAAAPVYRAVFFNSPTLVPGRYLLPAVGAVSTLLAWGIAGLSGQRWLALSAIPLGMLFLVCALAPHQLLEPAFRQPVRLSLERAQAESHPLELRYGDLAELIGFQTSSEVVPPGGELEVTLFWRVRQRTERTYTLALELREPGGGTIAVTRSWPGRGNYPTPLWQPGEILADSYRLRIPPTTEPGSVGRLRGVMYDYSSPAPTSMQFRNGGELSVFDPRGARVEPVFGRVRIATEP